MNTPENDIITLKNGYSGQELSITTHPDLKIYEWAKLFKVLLVFKEFHNESIDGVLKLEEE